MNFRYPILFLVVLIIGSATKISTAQEPSESSPELHAIIDTAWSFRFVQRPLDKGRENAHLGADLSSEALNHREAFWHSIAQRLSKIDTATLNADDRMNLRIFQYITEDEIAQFTFKTHLMPFNAEGGFHTGFGRIGSNTSLRNTEDVRRYLKRLKGFDMRVDQQLVHLRSAIQEGYVLPAAILKDYDQTASVYISNTVDESVFYQPFTRLPESIPADTASILQEEARRVIAESVNPAYERLAVFLRDAYVPAAPQEIGATHLPNGKAYYDQRIRYFTTLEMTAEEVYNQGLAEVARIRAEMQEIIDELKFEGSFDQFLTFLRTDPQFYATTPRDLLKEASYFAKKVDGKLPQYFGKLPRLPYGVAPVPDQIAPRYTGGRYVPGSYERHRAGTYWVNTYKLESRPLYVLPSLTMHEAVPGHHLQMSLAAEIEELPSFRNRYYISAFGEGWALYTEWLGTEMGIYETPYQRFGALTYEMWRACRLVVDPGMHAMGWTRDEAVQYMTENTALSLHEINTEIDRYIGWPGQAVSYKIGELKIRALRKEAEEALGTDFDLRAFHDKVLENGSVPLFILEEEVRKWIAGKRNSAGTN